MPQRIRWSFALLALALLTIAPAWASDTESLGPVAFDTVETVPVPEQPEALEIEIPSLDSQLAATLQSSCPIAKCFPDEHGCPSDCICRVINCVPQCLPLPLRPDSCQ